MTCVFSDEVLSCVRRLTDGKPDVDCLIRQPHHRLRIAVDGSVSLTGSMSLDAAYCTTTLERCDEIHRRAGTPFDPQGRGGEQKLPALELRSRLGYISQIHRVENRHAERGEHEHVQWR